MKKIVITLIAVLATCGFCITFAQDTQSQEMITIEIPANQIDAIDVKYKSQSATTSSKVKESTNKTVEATKKGYEKTKDATKKTWESTKEFTNTAVDNTKDVIEHLNPNKPVTLESIETSAAIKILKIERDTKKAAYNSKIKDIKAQIKAAEFSTTITDVERQNKIYTLNKEKTALVEQRDEIIQDYNNKIKEIRKNKKEQ